MNAHVLNVSYAACQIFDLLVFIGRSARIGSSTLHLVMLLFVHAIKHSTMYLLDDLHFTWYRVITSAIPVDKRSNPKCFRSPHLQNCAR